MSLLTEDSRCAKLGRGRRRGSSSFAGGGDSQHRRDKTILHSSSLSHRRRPSQIHCSTLSLRGPTSLLALYLTEAVRALAGDFFTLPTTIAAFEDGPNGLGRQGEKVHFFVPIDAPRLHHPLDSVKTQTTAYLKALCWSRGSSRDFGTRRLRADRWLGIPRWMLGHLRSQDQKQDAYREEAKCH